MATAKAIISQPVIESVELTISAEEASLLKSLVGQCIAGGATSNIWQALRDAGVETTHSVVEYNGKRAVGTLDLQPFEDF